MTREKYFEVCSQLNEDINLDKLPPELEDFPIDVQKAINVYNMLGDRIYPDIGYVGKDYTVAELYMKIFEVEDKQLFMETLLRIDAKTIEAAQKEMKAARDRMSVR